MTFTIGQTVTLTDNSEGYQNIALGHDYTVLSVHGEGETQDIEVTRDTGDPIYSTGRYPSRLFEAKTPAGRKVETVGAEVVVVESIYGIPVGTVGVVERTLDSDGDLYINLETYGYYYLKPEVLTLRANYSDETLAAYRVRFMAAAYARGVENGEEHEAQVVAALDDLARVEFLDPSETVEAFQKRIVTMAMDRKGRHRWCDEPEKFLRAFGLGHLVPTRKIVRVVLNIEVDLTNASDDQAYIDAATAKVEGIGNVRSSRILND